MRALDDRWTVKVKGPGPALEVLVGSGSLQPQTTVAGPELLDTPAAGEAAIRGGAVRVAGYVAGIGLSVVSSALLFRHLGVVAAGRYVTVITLVSLAGGVTDAGLVTIGLRELSTRPQEQVGSFFASLSGLRLVLALLGVLGAVAFAALAGYPAQMVGGTLMAGGGLMLQTSQNSFAMPLQAQLRLGWVTLAELLRQAFGAGAIVVLVWVGSPLLPFWAVTLPAGLAGSGLCAWLIRRTVPLGPGFDRTIWAPLLRDTLPYAAATAVGVIYFRLAILIMSLVSSARQTGYFGASFRVVDVGFVIPFLLVSSTFPVFARAARDDRDRLDRALGRLLDISLVLGLATGLMLLTGAGFVISVVAGPGFAPAAGVLQIQGVALVASFVGTVFSFGLLSLHRYRAVLLVNLTVLLLSGVLTGVLARTHGARGAAAATLIVEIIYTGMLGAARVRAGTRPQVSARTVSGAIVAALTGSLALLPAGLPEVVRPALALAIYTMMLLALGAVPREVPSLVRRPRMRRRRDRARRSGPPDGRGR
jgi:O-antigen/teichoic acid export membrane protein